MSKVGVFLQPRMRFPQDIMILLAFADFPITGKVVKIVDLNLGTLLTISGIPWRVNCCFN